MDDGINDTLDAVEALGPIPEPCDLDEIDRLLDALDE